MDINSMLEQIDFLKKEADSLRPFKPEWEQVFWEKFRLEFNYNSNHMEGNTLTYGQTKLLLLFDRLTGDFKARDVEEMKAHNVALKMISELAADSESRLTEKLIREINELILVRPFYNDAITPNGQPTKRLITPGEYKKQPNSVLLPDGNMFYYASPEETPAMMGDLMEWYNQNKNKIHPVRLAALVHYKLVRIHPFDDSNGRTARLVMNFILKLKGYAPVVIESKKKNAYLAALNKADVGDIGAFEEYISEVSIRWQEIFLKAIKGEKVEEPEDFEKEVELLKRNLKNSREKIQLTFNVNVLENIIAGSILPLLNAVQFYVSKLDDLYLKKEIQFKAIGHGNCIAMDGLRAFFSQILKNPITTPFKCEFHYIHQQLRKESKLNFAYTTDIYFDFYEIAYEIRNEALKNISLKKYYHEILSTDEITKFANALAKTELMVLQNLVS
jgi:Fic family protein